MDIDLSSLDPSSAGFASELHETATANKANLWVFGPLESRSIPLRAPESASTSDAAVLGTSVWPSTYAAIVTSDAEPVIELTPEQARIAGGRYATMIVRSYGNLPGGAGAFYGPDEIAPQSVAFLAVFDRMPGGARSRWDAFVLDTQRNIAAWLPLLFGAALGLFAVSLVASGSAFVYERRAIARERTREELALMRRDAHDKVYNRLSALSKRVAAAGDRLAADNARALSSIADDIRGTVGELQEIMGEQADRTGSTLTTVPLAEQISSVCRAQAARLAVEVLCEAADPLPEVSARLGWDLQCVAEEAITNAVRHGHAGRVRVSLAQVEPDTLEVTIADDGTGSAVLTADDAAETSTGLRGMRDRLAKHGGSLEIAANPSGTTLTARVPLDEGPERPDLG